MIHVPKKHPGEHGYKMELVVGPEVVSIAAPPKEETAKLKLWVDPNTLNVIDTVSGRVADNVRSYSLDVAANELPVLHLEIMGDKLV